MQHGHDFSRRRRLVEERCGGNLHAGQVADHGLERQKGLEASLCNLRLIRRIRRVPAGILQDISKDDAGGMAIVVAQPDVGLERLVPAGHCSELTEELVLRDGRRKVERLRQPNPLRHHFSDQGIQ